MSAAKNITYLGEKGNEARSDPLQWGGLEFEVGKPVLVDPEAAETSVDRRFFEYMIIKAKTHPALKLEDPELPARRRVKGRDDEDDGEENGNGDYDLSALPRDWRDQHHKKLIALARRLGGEGEALATRDGATAYIEEQVALGVIVPKAT